MYFIDLARLAQSHFRLNFSHILFGTLIRLVTLLLLPNQMQILNMHVLIAERNKCIVIRELQFGNMAVDYVRIS